MDEIRKRMGIEVVGEATCGECGKTFEITRRHDVVSDHCPHCLIKEEDDRLKQSLQDQQHNRHVRKYERYCSIPDDIIGKTFDDYTPHTSSQKQARAISERFVTGDMQEHSLVFQGSTGIGKSHLSYCIKQAFNEQGKTVIFIDTPEMMNRIKQSFGNYGDNYQEQLLKAMKNTDLLILDDIGAEYVKPDANGYESWAADIIFQIVNSRLGKQSIYTTNYTSKDLAKKYGMLSKRIISRMMSKAKVIKVDGEDQRLKGFE